MFVGRKWARALWQTRYNGNILDIRTRSRTRFVNNTRVTSAFRGRFVYMYRRLRPTEAEAGFIPDSWIIGPLRRESVPPNAIYRADVDI